MAILGGEGISERRKPLVEGVGMGYQKHLASVLTSPLSPQQLLECSEQSLADLVCTRNSHGVPGHRQLL